MILVQLMHLTLDREPSRRWVSSVRCAARANVSDCPHPSHPGRVHHCHGAAIDTAGHLRQQSVSQQDRSRRQIEWDLRHLVFSPSCSRLSWPWPSLSGRHFPPNSACDRQRVLGVADCPRHPDPWLHDAGALDGRALGLRRGKAIRHALCPSVARPDAVYICPQCWGLAVVMAETRARSIKDLHERAQRWSREIVAALVLTLLTIALLMAAIGREATGPSAAPTKSSELRQQ